MVRASGVIILRTVLVWLQECIARHCHIRCYVFLKKHSRNALSAFVGSLVSFLSLRCRSFEDLGLRPKMYPLRFVNGEEKKTTRGVSKSVIINQLRHVIASSAELKGSS